MRADWCRVTRKEICPCCGKPDWCLVRLDGTAAICARISDGAKRNIVGSGWLHELTETLPPKRIPPKQPKVAAVAMGSMMKIMRNDIAKIRRLAQQLGVDSSTLYDLGIGWSERYNAYAFPMRNGHPRVVIGIHFRTIEGQKFALPGSRNGLFMPRGVIRPPLLICEGMSDTAALMDLGFSAIGRPSCIGGVRHILDLVGFYENRWLVVIVADNDGPGRDGAKALADRLPNETRIIVPPAADARTWVRAGACRPDVERLIAETTPRQYA